MKHLLFCLSAIALFASCSNSDILEDVALDNPEIINQPEANFFALTVGNSWVYKNYRLNKETGNYDYTGVIDSISIVGTEDFEGDTYFNFRRLTTGNEDGITYCNANGEHFELKREENGNLVNKTGFIKFASCNYEERLLTEQVWGSLHEITLEENSTISVEAGEFTCVTSNRFTIAPNGERAKSLDWFYYANGIGLIYDTTSWSDDDTPTIIRRLDSYVVQ